ncbi:MAG TPA: hypothetical protein VF807_03205 [Ktedonobacterales bacterium]
MLFRGLPPARWLTIVLVVLLGALVGYGVAQAGAIGWLMLAVLIVFVAIPALVIGLDWWRTRQGQRAPRDDGPA